ncbi:forkhead box o4 [Fusarium albosuccineum]|uniref:Forkhead box o4 n=1 Tax=Fusarium albosuccineum TaxID=1237068 RepID=A0A8H4L4I1_9HYPO|nr:forkhead box o4 [Fusarium albosuccineum]
MDPPFPHGGQPSSYTNALLPGHGQQSSCVSELTGMGSYYALSSGPQDQSPLLSATGSLSVGSTLSQQPQHHQPQRSHPTHNPAGFAHMSSSLHYPPRSHQFWPSPPPGPDDNDNYSYNSSPTCGSAPTTCYNPSPVSPRTWSSPDFPLPQASDSLHHQNQQDPFKNLRICTPTSTEGFPVRGPQVLTPFTASMNHNLDGEVDGLPHTRSPATIPSSSAGVLSSTNSPREPRLDTPAYMAATKDDSLVGEPETRASLDRQSETGELQGSGAGAKPEEPYAQLIYRALMSAPGHAMTLQEIYQWFRENTDKDAKCDKTAKKVGKNAEGWQNSIRHNLSMNKAFTKREQKKTPSSESNAIDQTLSTANADPKRSTEWTLENWAVSDGVQSTTRYRGKGNSTRRATGSKILHHPYNHGFQQHGNPISTKAISGRKGGYATSKSKLRGRHYSHETGMPPTPTSHHIMPQGLQPIRRSTMPGMYQQPPPYAYEDMMTPRLQRQPQMTIKTEHDYSSLTPQATAHNSFGMMLPDPSLLHAHTVTSGVSSNPGTASYTLAGGGQGNMYVGASPCEFPYGLVDVTGVYQGSGGHHAASGGVDERLLGMGQNTVYNWSNNGL